MVMFFIGVRLYNMGSCKKVIIIKLYIKHSTRRFYVSGCDFTRGSGTIGKSAQLLNM